jgi:hypothetical protein
MSLVYFVSVQEEDMSTHAAVQAKISTLLAFVTIARLMENIIVNAQRTARRRPRSCTKNSAIVERSGAMDANIVARISIVFLIFALE